MDTALIVGSEKVAAALTPLMTPVYYSRTVHVASAAKARQALSSREWGLVVINAPLPDEAASTLAEDISHQYSCNILLLDTALSGSESRVITLIKPVNRLLFENTLQVLGTVRQQLMALRTENQKLAFKLEEARLIGRAKCALIAYRQMTENEAHRYIEKQAMDSRLPRREVAKEILQIYEE